MSMFGLIDHDNRLIHIADAETPLHDARLRWVTLPDPAPEIGSRLSDDGKTFIVPNMPNVPQAKGIVANRLRAACQADIEGGFQCDALDKTHDYPSDQHSQHNLQSVRNSAAPDIRLLCGFAGVWGLRPHGTAQIEAVNSAWIVHRQARQLKLANKLAAVATATTAEQALAVTW